MRILLQSADPAAVQSLCTALHDYEVTVSGSTTGQDDSDGGTPDLVILDLRENHATRWSGRTGDAADQRPAVLGLITPGQAVPANTDAAVPYPTDDETLRQVARLLLQLTEERRERRRTGAMIRALAESVECGLLLTDRDGRIIFSNRGVERLFGYTPAEARDLAAVEELVPPDRRAAIHRARIALLDDPDGTSGIVQHWMHRDGTIIDTDVAARRFFDRGEPVGLVVELHDVGEELQLRERLYDATTRLFRVEVLHGQIRAFTRHVGLVLRRLGQQPGEASDDLQALERRAEELAADMRRVLESPDDSAGLLTAQEFWSLAEDAAGIARDLIGGRLRVEIEVEDELPAVDVALPDMSRLLRRMVAASCSPLQEGMRNPRDFTYEPELFIRFVRPDVAATGGAILVEVLHNGPADDVQAVPPTIERFAGQYEAEARYLFRVDERRSGFSVLLPDSVTADSQDVTTSRSLEPPPVWSERLATSRQEGPTVLLVLDQVRLHEFLAPSLLDGGYRVRSVTSIEAALRLLSQEHFEVAVIGLDVGLTDPGATASSLRSASPETALVFAGDAVMDDVTNRVVTVSDPTDVVLLAEAIAQVLAEPSSVN